MKKGATRFCSMLCHRTVERERRERILLAGEYPPLRNQNAFLPSFLIERLGELCSRCGWNERNVLTGRVPIEIEHIDRDWRNNCWKSYAAVAEFPQSDINLQGPEPGTWSAPSKKRIGPT